MKSNSISRGYTLAAGVDLIFPASFGRSQFFVVNTSTDDVLIAYGESPADADFVPIVGENGHIDLQPQPQTRVTLRSEVGGSIVIATDVHTTLDNVQPYIVTGPLSVKLASGADVTLSVDVANADGMTYEWFSSVDGRVWVTTSVATATLPLTDVTASVFYRVEVSNSVGTSVFSERASLIVGSFTVPATVLPPSTKPTFVVSVLEGAGDYLGAFGALKNPTNNANDFGDIVPQDFDGGYEAPGGFTIIQVTAVAGVRVYMFARPSAFHITPTLRASFDGKIYNFTREFVDGVPQGFECDNPLLINYLIDAVGTDVTVVLLSKG